VIKTASAMGLVLIALALWACGGAAAPAPAASAVPVAATQPAVASAPGATAVTPVTAATTAKVSANTATNEELIAAFAAAGIPNPSSWAREVQEYRPYAATDTNFTKLRDALVKYNPAAGVVDKIVATLK
jgi:hypothetical protein